MNRQKWILLVLTVGLMAGAAGLLARVSTHQKLGLPGVKTAASEEPGRLKVVLPEEVLDYTSEELEIDDTSKNALPKDTSFGERQYEGLDGTKLQLSVILMGTDRTSLHKPQFCLEGQGWHIDPGANLETKVHIAKPYPYDLPVVRLISSQEGTVEGQRRLVKNVYVYWYVADDGLSSSALGFQRMWMMASKLLRTGELQRWAYVSCSGVCLPGQEEALFERIKRFIAAATPEFQLNPHPLSAATTAKN
jgi:hypothetical protein